MVRVKYKQAAYIGKFLLKAIGYYGFLFVVMYAFYPSELKSRLGDLAASAVQPESVYREVDELDVCVDAYTTQEMINCSIESFKIIDEINLKYFNEVIKNRQAGLMVESESYEDNKPGALAAYKKSRDHFIKFRDELCSSQYWLAGGTRRHNLYSNCMEVLTKQHTLYIWQSGLKDYQGNSVSDDFPEPALRFHGTLFGS
jgi:uncharacterized protein YecT (DUF1311 family)